MTGWSTRLWVLGGSLLLLVLIYGATSVSFLQAWSRDPLGHGYLVLPGALYLAWTRRERLRRVQSQPSLLVVAAAWRSSRFSGWSPRSPARQRCSNSASRLMVVGFVWGTLGTAAARELAFPLGFLLFAVPIGDYLVRHSRTSPLPSPSSYCSSPACLFCSTGESSASLAALGSRISLQWHQLPDVCARDGVFVRWLGLSLERSSSRFLSVRDSGCAAGERSARLPHDLFAAAGAPEFAAGMRHYLVGWVVFGIILGGHVCRSATASKRKASGTLRPRAHDNGRALVIGVFVL